LVAAIREQNPNIATTDQISMADKISASESVSLRRSSAWLVGGFAALALVLAIVGLYGVVAYSVNRRTREIGIRMALGAERGTVYGLILREAGWLAAFGLAAGLFCSIGAAGLIRSMLFRVRAWDGMTLAAVAFVLGAAAILASFLPARRAASVDPVEALRTE
jgi:ABC-type antimicrobial peptide transport system permease subunit